MVPVYQRCVALIRENVLRREWALLEGSCCQSARKGHLQSYLPRRENVILGCLLITSNEGTKRCIRRRKVDSTQSRKVAIPPGCFVPSKAKLTGSVLMRSRLPMIPSTRPPLIPMSNNRVAIGIVVSVKPCLFSVSPSWCRPNRGAVVTPFRKKISYLGVVC
jgi:hypothetical protein